MRGRGRKSELHGAGEGEAGYKLFLSERMGYDKEKREGKGKNQEKGDVQPFFVVEETSEKFERSLRNSCVFFSFLLRLFGSNSTWKRLDISASGHHHLSTA